MSKNFQILAGETHDGELYFVEVAPVSAEHTYFAIGGFTVRPTKKSEALERCREQLEDDVKLWRGAVAAGYTQLGHQDWVQYVLATDGELAGFDNSLYAEELEVNGDQWLFESGSCGQHHEQNLKRYYIPEVYFDKLLAMWKTHHLKKENPLGLTGLLDDLRVEGWTHKNTQTAFITETIKSIE